jgi:hypothetical protein
MRFRFAGNLFASHRNNSVVNLYAGVIRITKAIIFNICFVSKTNIARFINAPAPNIEVRMPALC